MNEIDNLWKRLVNEHRTARNVADTLADTCPPPGFTTRVAAGAMAIRQQRIDRFRWWQRSLWRCAACSLTLAAGLFVADSRRSSAAPDGLLLAVPTVEVPEPFEP